MYKDNCNLCGCELGNGSLNKRTNILFNKSMCMKWNNDTLSMVYVQEYYKEHGTLDGCYDYMLETYSDQIDRATNRFHEYSKNSTNLTWEQHRDIIIHHFACESIAGFHIELDVMDKIKEIRPDVTFEHTDIDTDLNYAIDFFVYKGDKCLCGVQAKGISWYYWIKKQEQQALNAGRSTDNKWNKYKEKHNDPDLKIVTVMIDKGELVALSNNEKLQTINIRNSK